MQEHKIYQLYKESRFFYPVSISLLLHVIFLFCTMLIVLPRYFGGPQEEILNFRVRAVTKNPIIQTRGNTPNPRAGLSAVALRRKSAGYLKRSLNDVPVESEALDFLFPVSFGSAPATSVPTV